MIYTLKNDKLAVAVCSLGAEIQSIKSVKTGIEYLWQGNPTYWKNRATVIFPVCGRLCDGKYTYKGKTYEMLIHGFAKLCEFELESQKETQIVLTLTANDFTRAQYPFEFVLKLTYTLEGNSIKQQFTVENKDQKTLIFSVGGHPGFNAPFVDGEEFSDYYLEFVKPTNQNNVVFKPNGLWTGEVEPYNLVENRILPLSHELFTGNEPFLQGDCREVSLKSKKNDYSITLKYDDFLTLGTWQTDNSDARFICIEPWSSLPAISGVVDDLETKKLMEHLPLGKTFNASFTITINE